MNPVKSAVGKSTQLNFRIVNTIFFEKISKNFNVVIEFMNFDPVTMAKLILNKMSDIFCGSVRLIFCIQFIITSIKMICLK